MEEPSRFKYAASYQLHGLLKAMHYLRDTSQERQKPMQVLALGLSRCGTDSLRVALEELGFTKCYHGYVCQNESRPDPMHWARLMAKKFSQKPKEGKVLPEPIQVSRAEFDRMLWDCTAVTDAPAAIFAPELIRAYPEAKVILNRRNDVDKWATSMKLSVIHLARRITGFLYFLSWFDAESFWVTRVHLWMSDDFFRCNFDRYGKQIYEEHYQQIKDMLPPDAYLEWCVQDGWEPLCAFLDNKPVPAHEFPDGNKLYDWQQKVRNNSRRMVKRSLKKLGLCLAFTTTASTLFLAYRRLKKR